MTRLPLSIALGDYEHARDVVSGAVPIEGIEPYFSTLGIEEVTFRFMGHADFDVSELSFGNYCSLLSRPEPPAIAIPVFLSRVFRHGAFYVRADSGLNSIKQLAGKTIGLPQWSQTATIYARGLLSDMGIDLAGIHWVQAGLHQKGRKESATLNLPKGITIIAATKRSLTELLLSSEIDVIISARPPEFEFGGKTEIRRLLSDPRAAEMAYWKEKQVFPIMHLLVLNRASYGKNRWIARNIMHAFNLAKQRSVARLAERAVSYIPMAWGSEDYAQMNERMFTGQDPWPYGLSASRPTIETFLNYCYQQGITSRLFEPEEIFAPETLLEAKI